MIIIILIEALRLMFLKEIQDRYFISLQLAIQSFFWHNLKPFPWFTRSFWVSSLIFAALDNQPYLSWMFQVFFQFEPFHNVFSAPPVFTFSSQTLLLSSIFKLFSLLFIPLNPYSNQLELIFLQPLYYLVFVFLQRNI